MYTFEHKLPELNQVVLSRGWGGMETFIYRGGDTLIPTDPSSVGVEITPYRVWYELPDEKVYVIGFFGDDMGGGFVWYRDPFQAGRAYEAEQRTGYDTVYFRKALVPDLSDDEITEYIDTYLLPSFEELTGGA